MALNKFTNRQRALSRMQRIPPVVIDAARAQLNVEGQGVVDAIKPNVPFDPSGDDHLRDTVKFRPTEDTATKVAIVVVEGETSDPAEKRKARGVEFGHIDARSGVHVPAQPHFFPTYRLRKGGIRRRMIAAARRAIRKLTS